MNISCTYPRQEFFALLPDEIRQILLLHLVQLDVAHDLVTHLRAPVINHNGF